MGPGWAEWQRRPGLCWSRGPGGRRAGAQRGSRTEGLASPLALDLLPPSLTGLPVWAPSQPRGEGRAGRVAATLSDMGAPARRPPLCPPHQQAPFLAHTPPRQPPLRVAAQAEARGDLPWAWAHWPGGQGWCLQVSHWGSPQWNSGCRQVQPPPGQAWAGRGQAGPSVAGQSPPPQGCPLSSPPGWRGIRAGSPRSDTSRGQRAPVWEPGPSLGPPLHPEWLQPCLGPGEALTDKEAAWGPLSPCTAPAAVGLEAVCLSSSRPGPRTPQGDALGCLPFDMRPPNRHIPPAPHPQPQVRDGSGGWGAGSGLGDDQGLVRHSVGTRTPGPCWKRLPSPRPGSPPQATNGSRAASTPRACGGARGSGPGMLAHCFPLPGLRTRRERSASEPGAGTPSPPARCAPYPKHTGCSSARSSRCLC